MPAPNGTPLHGSAAVSAKPRPTSNDMPASRPHNHPSRPQDPSRPQADPEKHARFRGKSVSPELRRHLGGPKSTSYDKRASGSMAASAGPNRPRTMRPLPDSTAASVRPKPTPSNKPASVENLFPRSSAATPCGTNRNLQQENHSNFTVASPHSPNTMAPGRHHDIRRDLPPISGAALLPIADSRSARIPAGRTGVRRPVCRRFQSHTDPDPQACVVDRDQSPPWKSRSRRPHLLPHVAAPSLHNGFTTAHSFHTSVFTSRCYSFLTP